MYATPQTTTGPSAEEPSDIHLDPGAGTWTTTLGQPSALGGTVDSTHTSEGLLGLVSPGGTDDCTEVNSRA